ncbi:hypothetical protein HDU67_001280 [Dinochytrium kinnereticum]|nr:hypothetical protein HDU67_001280 [Dinochytrium kinnereticum]
MSSATTQSKNLSYAQLAKNNASVPPQQPSAPSTATTATPTLTPANSNSSATAKGTSSSTNPSGPRHGNNNQGNRNHTNNRNPQQQQQQGGRGAPANPRNGSSAPVNPPPPSKPAVAPVSASNNTPLNFAAAAAAAAAKASAAQTAPPPPTPSPAAPSTTVTTPATKAEQPASSDAKKPVAAAASEQQQQQPQQPLPARPQSQGKPPSAWSAEGGLTFKANVVPPSQTVSTKVRFGSQPEAEEQQQQKQVPASVVATPPAATTAPVPVAAPVPSNMESVQPLAPTPMHGRSNNFSPQIPRTLSAPPQLDKMINSQNPQLPQMAKGASQKGNQQPPTPAAPIQATLAPEEQSNMTAHAPVYMNPQMQPPHHVHPNMPPHPQHHGHGPSHGNPNGAPPHHPLAHPHHQSFPQGAPPPPGSHFGPGQIPQQNAPQPFHPGQQPPPHQQQQHFNPARPAHIRPPPGGIPQQGMMPSQYPAKPNFKGPNQYNQAPQGGANIPPHPPAMAQVPVPAGSPYYAPYYGYPFEPYGYQPQYYSAQQVPFPAPQMIRPVTPGGPQPTPRYPGPAPTAASPFIPPSLTPTKTPSKAIRIINPATKEAVVIDKTATAPTPLAAPAAPRPEVVKEKLPIQVTLKDPKGNKIELKSPSKSVEKAEEAVKKEAEVVVAETPAVEAEKTVEVAPEVEEDAKVEEPEVVAAEPAKVEEPVEVAAAEPEAEEAVVEAAVVEAPVVVEKQEKPAIVVSAASEVELPEVEKAAEVVGDELEDGEIPAAEGETAAAAPVAITDKKMAAEPDASPEEATKAPSKKPVEVRVLTSFDGLTYPEGVVGPAIVKGIIKYHPGCLRLFSMYNIAPKGLPPLEIFNEEGQKQSPRTSRPSSGSGSGFHSGSGAASGHATPKRVGGGAMGSFHVKGIIPGVAAPSSSRPISGRSSVGPGGQGYNVGGGGSARNSQGSWDSKGGQGLPPRPGGGGGSRTGGHSRQSHGQTQQQEPPGEVLKMGQNAWVPDVMRGKTMTKAQEDAEAAAEAQEMLVVKKAKGLLNKLTIEKFDTISDQFLALPITTQSLLKKIIELIFDKALDEHHFQNMYGRLCQKLSSELPKVQKWIDMDAKNNIFRRLLLNKCQEEFERNEKWSQTDADDALSRKERLQRLHEMSAEEKAQYAEDEFQRNKLKRRVLGNISFIGELFKLSMITEKIMHSCVHQLLIKVVDPEEEETECLCKLLKSIGERLDHSAAKNHIDVYFVRIRELSINMKLSARIRFMLQDLIEQRRNKWKARQEVAGPMTIAEIHEREERKQREEEEAIRQRNAAGGGGGRGGGKGGRGYSGRQGSMGGGKSQDARAGGDGSGWNTVAEKARSSRQVDDNLNNFGKLDVKKPSGAMRFGPPAASTWTGGAQGGALRDEGGEKAGGRPAGGNMFSVLSGASEVPDRKKSVDIARSTTPTSTDSSPKPEKTATAAPTKLPKVLATRKIDAMVEEWFTIFDVSEMVAGQKELGTDDYNFDLVHKVLEKALEKKPDVVRKTADLFNHLVKEEVVSEGDLMKCINEFVAVIDDLSFDIPAVYKYIGTIYGRLLPLETSTITVPAILEVLQPKILAEAKSRMPSMPKVLAEAFSVVVSTDSELFLQRILKETPADLKMLWAPERRSEDVLAEWMEVNGLFFLNPLMKVSRGLRAKLGDPEAALAWLKQDEIAAIEERDETIFANGVKNPLELSREHFVKQEEILTAHLVLFETFIRKSDDKVGEKEVEVLFACQEYWAECDKLKTFLEHLFRIFLKVKIVDEEAISAWKSNKSRLQPSKKAALEELSNWFKSIRQS